MPFALADVRDVCFCHWPVDPEALEDRLPDALEPAMRDGRAWVSVLAQRTLAGIRGLPVRYQFPQVTLRTYVVPRERASSSDSEPADPGRDRTGVHFLRVEAGSRVATRGARLAFGMPFVYAAVEHDRDERRFRVRSGPASGRSNGRPIDRRRTGRPRFEATVEPRGDPTPVDPDSLVGWLTERYYYYLADGRCGTTAHPAWRLQDADATVDADGLFAAAELPAPTAEPTVRYSPGVEIRLTERP